MRKTIMTVLAAAAMAATACDSPVENIDLRVDYVTVAPTDRVLTVGDTMRLTAYPTTADGQILGSVAVAWQSDAPTVLEIASTNTGASAVVTAKAVGTATVRAVSEGKTGLVNVTVVAAPLHVARVEISAAATTMAVGAQQTIHAAGYTADSAVVMGRPVAWSSSNPSVMTVAGFPGMTTASLGALAPGVVTISATIDGVRRDVQFTVTASSPPPSPAVAWVVFPTNRTGMWELQNKVMQARTLQSNGLELTGRKVTYSVENEQVATVDSTGLVIARNAGSTRIVAESEGIRGYAHLHVYEVTQVMTFALTYDWWDGEVRVMEGMGTTTWTDAAGAEQTATSYAQTGTFTLDRTAGTYTRVIEAVAHAVVDGAIAEVGRRTYTDTGAMYYNWSPFEDGATEFSFVSTTTPGLTYGGALRSGGELMVRMPVLGNELRNVLFRIAQ